MEPVPDVRRGRRRRALELAGAQGGVLSRRQLYAAGFSRGEVRAQVRAERWQQLGRHCVVLHTGPLTERARWWSAVLEGGPRALLDGESALVAAGLARWETARIRVSVPRGARVRHRGTAVDVRQTRRWDVDDLEPGSSPPRTRSAVAAVRAGLWARTERQAVLVVTMAVQQRLVTAEELAAELLRIRRDPRRVLLGGLVLDLAGGSGSLGELDVLRALRRRGLPEPDQQVLRRTSSGSHYLDFRWDRWAVVLEVDGVQHTWAENLVADAVRHNAVAMAGDVVLRLPVLGLRLVPELFLDQVEEALRRAGWDDGGAVAS